MYQTQRRDVRRPCWPLLGVLLLSINTAFADDTLEREQLSVLLRQLSMLDRQAERGVPLATQSRSRYHFDYARLRDDLARIRLGINDYLTPQRAQPRDPSEILPALWITALGWAGVRAGGVLQGLSNGTQAAGQAGSKGSNVLIQEVKNR